jgi:hypothetical protein
MDLLGVDSIGSLKTDSLTEVGFQQFPQTFRSILPKQQEQTTDAQQPTIDAWDTSEKGPGRGSRRREAGEEEI